MSPNPHILFHIIIFLKLLFNFNNKLLIPINFKYPSNIFNFYFIYFNFSFGTFQLSNGFKSNNEEHAENM